MNLNQNLILSLEILTTHKLRTLLSIVGVVVGVGAVVLMVSAGRGAEKQVLSCIQGMGTNLLIVNAGRTSIVAGRQRQMDTVKTLLPADAQAIAKECSSVALAAPAVSKKLPIRWEDQNAITNIIGMSSEGLIVRNIALVTGRAFEPEECRASKRIAILGPTAVANLFGATDPIGQQIRINKVPFEVIGVTAPKGMDINGLDQDDLIIVPLETAMRRLLNVVHIQTVYIQARSSKALDTAEREITALLHQRHRLQGKADDFTIQNQVTLLETERETKNTMTLLIGSVAGISLLVGGVGILAVMLMSVRERMHEIGLRRAVGALHRDIRTQFLIESALLAGTGGIVGVILGMGAAIAVSALGYWPIVISWPAAAVAFGFSVAIGVFFGLYPAIRAARQEPIHALRAE
jgi:putative ABC transport system permease protein